MTVLVPERPNRRDFLSWASYSLLGIGAMAATWPFIDSMNPTGETIEETKVYMDLSGLEAGKTRETMWRGRPILVVWRTAAQLARLESSHPPPARQAAPPSPAYTQNWHRSINPAIFVVVPLCPHLGYRLILRRTETFSYGPDPNDWTDWVSPDPDNIEFFCPNDGSTFDLAGRRLTGPAEADLYIPPYRFFPDRNHLILGEDPPA